MKYKEFCHKYFCFCLKFTFTRPILRSKYSHIYVFMKISLLLALFIISSLLAVRSGAQTDEQVRAILYLTGAESMESLDEPEVEKYANMLSKPLEINFLKLSKLTSSGLMTQYQAASLSDYKARNGDILSLRNSPQSMASERSMFLL